MVKTDRIENKTVHARHEDDNEKKLFRLRQTVNTMFFSYHLSRRAIARELDVSRTFVIRWTQSPDQDCSTDMRGWTKGVRRKWDTSVERTIREIHRHLKEDPRQFYTGATAIAQEWRLKYPGPPFLPCVPSERSCRTWALRWRSHGSKERAPLGICAIPNIPSTPVWKRG